MPLNGIKNEERNKSIWKFPDKVGKGLAVMDEYHNTFPLLTK